MSIDEHTADSRKNQLKYGSLMGQILQLSILRYEMNIGSSESAESHERYSRERYSHSTEERY